MTARGVQPHHASNVYAQNLHTCECVCNSLRRYTLAADLPTPVYTRQEVFPARTRPAVSGRPPGSPAICVSHTVRAENLTRRAVPTRPPRRLRGGCLFVRLRTYYTWHGGDSPETPAVARPNNNQFCFITIGINQYNFMCNQYLDVRNKNTLLLNIYSSVYNLTFSRVYPNNIIIIIYDYHLSPFFFLHKTQSHSNA